MAGGFKFFGGSLNNLSPFEMSRGGCIESDRHEENVRMSSGLFSGKSWLTTWSIVLLISTLIGFFFAAQMHYSSAAFGHPVGWGQALYWALGDWYEWAILSPLIF